MSNPRDECSQLVRPSLSIPSDPVPEAVLKRRFLLQAPMRPGYDLLLRAWEYYFICFCLWPLSEHGADVLER